MSAAAGRLDPCKPHGAGDRRPVADCIHGSTCRDCGGQPAYDVNALPFLVVLAGASLSGRTKASDFVAPLGMVAIALLAPPSVPIVPWVILGILGVTVARLGLEGIRYLRGAMSTQALRRRVIWGFAGAAIAIQLIAALVLVSARQTIVDWWIARPENWSAYGAETKQASVVPVVLRPSDLPSSMRRVSYQEAALLPRRSVQEPGRSRGLIRTYPDLAVGTEYVCISKFTESIKATTNCWSLRTGALSGNGPGTSPK